MSYHQSMNLAMQSNYIRYINGEPILAAPIPNTILFVKKCAGEFILFNISTGFASLVLVLCCYSSILWAID